MKLPAIGLLLTIASLLFSISTVQAQNINGNWYGTIRDGGKEFPVLFILKSSHRHQLSGEIVTPLGSRMLKRCQINRDSLYFIDNFGSNILHHYAKVYSDSITMKMKGLWGNNRFYYFTLTRKNTLSSNGIGLKVDSLFVQKQVP
ncbi:MAG TPA: hypothetical protein VKA08_04870 [Balneolales bacterium]|nr:hypothetical protein [Balneolales bacterium]